MTHHAMCEAFGSAALEREGCRRADETIEHDRYAKQARRDNRSGHGCDFASAQDPQGIQPIAYGVSMQSNSLGDDLDLALNHPDRDPGPSAAPVHRLAAQKCEADAPIRRMALPTSCQDSI